MAFNLKAGTIVPSNEIMLPTMGAEVVAVESVTDNPLTGEFYRVSGTIHPVDPNGYDILFQMGFPKEWNGKLLQFCGGGLDGFVSPVEWLRMGSSFGGISPIKQGYLCYTCDSGHQIDEKGQWNAEWALNSEALENFAHKAFKKLKDVAVALSARGYGALPDKVYLAGGSNGGRECLKCLEQYPNDFDGALCFYPVAHFTLKVMKDLALGLKLKELGKDAYMSYEDYAAVQNVIFDCCDGLDGLKDGLIGNVVEAREKRSEIETKLEQALSSAQMEFLRAAAKPFSVSFALGRGRTEFPAYAVFEGVPLVDKFNSWFGKSPDETEFDSVVGAENVIRYMILGGKKINFASFDPEEYQAEMVAASELLDAYGVDLTAFKNRGGKLILVHGLSDNLVPYEVSVQLYERLKAQFGEETLSTFLQFYLVPGYGHGFSEYFQMDAGFVSALDEWVREGKKPETLIAEDANDTVYHRKRPLYSYPYYAEYSGTGDVNRAESFYSKKYKE